ncbi:tRNA (uridine(34)/cytosine(34)/5-carboxymethylaminomethyluridine(34)-2'-O)-methyltransferase TrmL [Hippea maritima]|uniref:Putative tRNA (cytidine(34)-2'-O)-methyltransferase n=1 Tax=Hippea maritima (strain ATCC 700847 / DSM 10411 / MH2) TaxID=760142 RepID=F2LXW1_HIPMA|nr:tRNA (uridine(34)/cytosine(34)/5-carboxymethylaminomethyluridine(34)-2'-O)-methyltransferase TrmL [Hippea maritima]AEA34352.1 tRNA/rRNA methyltransferase (SpoU) [Hippea maritima DSM 10411]
MQRNFLLNDNHKCNFHIVLFQPDIPPNTGNIARLCVATNSTLHLIKPLGFSLNDKRLKRAGLDYWENLKLEMHDSLSDFLNKYGNRKFFLASTKAVKPYFEVYFEEGDFLIFGSETQGLPNDFIEANLDKAINIPMTDKVRSLNLADSVAVVLYEAIRQVCF